jgi:hypothetical protein
MIGFSTVTITKLTMSGMRLEFALVIGVLLCLAAVFSMAWLSVKPESCL